MNEIAAKKVGGVGASSGLGRCFSIGLAQRGSKVALLARPQDKIDEAAAEAGNGDVGIACNVTDADSCATAIATAADRRPRASGDVDFGSREGHPRAATMFGRSTIVRIPGSARHT